MSDQDRNLIAVSIEAGIAEVRLNRPAKMNALNDAMFNGLVDAGEKLIGDNSVRAIVLSGEGPAFSAGLDTSNFSIMASADENVSYPKVAPRTHGNANRGQYVALLWRRMAVPVIAAIHGVAYGAGLQLALGADLRYATADAKFALREMRWGLIPDMAGFALLRSLARDDVVRELTYSGRVFTGVEAVGYGVATRLAADPRAAALTFAREVVDSNPDAIRAAKRVINMCADSNADALLYAESVEQDLIIGSPNQAEAVTASMQRRKPHFTDPASAV